MRWGCGDADSCDLFDHQLSSERMPKLTQILDNTQGQSEVGTYHVAQTTRPPRLTKSLNSRRTQSQCRVWCWIRKRDRHQVHIWLLGLFFESLTALRLKNYKKQPKPKVSPAWSNPSSNCSDSPSRLTTYMQPEIVEITRWCLWSIIKR